MLFVYPFIKINYMYVISSYYTFRIIFCKIITVSIIFENIN